ncbi:unnamed protein product [Prunus armeniaca]
MVILCDEKVVLRDEVYSFVAQNFDVDKSLSDKKWLFYATEKLFARRNIYFFTQTSSSTYLHFAIAESEYKENFQNLYVLCCAAVFAGNSIRSLAVGYVAGLCIPEWDRALTRGIRCANEYLDGIEDFIEFTRRHNPGATRIHCPCRRCNNTLWETIENVGFHLVRNGMIETYSIWNLYEEQLEHASSSNATRVDNVEPIVDANDQVMDII